MEQTLFINQMAAAEKNEKIRSTVQREGQRLWNYIRRRVKNDFDAEDILQDVFYRFTTAMRSQTIDDIVSWLFKVAGNRIIDSYRKHKDVPIDNIMAAPSPDEETVPLNLEDILFDPASDPDDLYFRSTVWTLLSEALDELPPAQREVFVMHELEDKSFNEISAETGISVNTLISRKRYAILYLRDRLQNLYDVFFEK